MDPNTIDWMIHRVNTAIARAKATIMELDEVLNGLKKLRQEAEDQ